MNREKALDLIGVVVMLVLACVLCWKATHFTQWSAWLHAAAVGSVVGSGYYLWRGLTRRVPAS
jgi:hypothetical protein